MKSSFVVNPKKNTAKEQDVFMC